jgi:glycine cleavage system H protein
MSEVPADLKYTESHEWIQLGDDGVVAIGITDHAQAALGDLVFVELPEVDTELDASDACAVVESVKAASDIYAPIAGTVVAVNEMLADEPEKINDDPYVDGWIFKLKLADEASLDDLMDASAYSETLVD